MGTFVENVNLIALAINKQLDAVRKVILKGTVAPDDKIGEDGDKYMQYSLDSVNFYKEYTKHDGSWVLLFDDAGEWLSADGSVLMQHEYMYDIPTTEYPANPRLKHDGSIMYKKYVDDADTLLRDANTALSQSTDTRLIELEALSDAYQLASNAQIFYEYDTRQLATNGTFLVGASDPTDLTDYGLPTPQPGTDPVLDPTIGTRGLLQVRNFVNSDGSEYGVYHEFDDLTSGLRWERSVALPLTPPGDWSPWRQTVLESRLEAIEDDAKELWLHKLEVTGDAANSKKLGGQFPDFYSPATHDHAGVYIDVLGQTPFDGSYTPTASQVQHAATVNFVLEQISNIDYGSFLTKDGLIELDAGYIPTAEQGISTKKYTDEELSYGLSHKYDKSGGVVAGNVTVGDGTTGNALSVRGNGSSSVALRRSDNSIAMAFVSIDGSGLKSIETYAAGGSGEGRYTFEADGNLSIIAATPVSSNNLARKDYVDSQVSAGVVTVVDNLTSTSTTSALSANQGKILKDAQANFLSNSDVVNDLTTGGADVPLSADMGLQLNSNKLESSDLNDYAKYTEANTWQAAQIQEVVFTTVSGTYIADVSSSSMTRVTISGATVVLGSIGGVEGMSGSIQVTIDAGAALSFDSTFRFPDGVAPTLNGTSVISYVCYEDGFLISTAVTNIPVTPPVP